MPFIMHLAKQEGWNPGRHDAACFFQADPQGFFIGELNGEPIGCIAAVSYGTAFGFIGLYIVAPGFRGRGYGYQLWRTAIDHLSHRTIGLDGVVEQQENYRKSGFQRFYRNIRFQGPIERSGNEQCVDVHEVPFEQLIAYDFSIFNYPRQAFLQAWVQHRGLAVVSKGQLLGYGIIRPCVTGWKIGPLFADSSEIAKALYAGLSFKAGEGPVFLDVPEINREALALAESFQMKKVFETARMYTDTPLQKNLSKIFGVSTFELG